MTKANLGAAEVTKIVVGGRADISGVGVGDLVVGKCSVVVVVVVVVMMMIIMSITIII